MYKPAIDRTIKDLKKNGALVFHGIDATKLDQQNQVEQLDPDQSKFDRIVWNFPHGGFPDEEKNEHRGPGFEWQENVTENHSQLVQDFFDTAKALLKEEGKIIITHKTIEPFGLWDIPGMG